jgi:hypothetical protein
MAFAEAVRDWRSAASLPGGLLVSPDNRRAEQPRGRRPISAAAAVPTRGRMECRWYRVEVIKNAVQEANPTPATNPV